MATIVPNTPSIGDIAKFIQILGIYGIGEGEVRKFIDEMPYRMSVVEAMRQKNIPLVDITGEFDQEAMNRLVKHLFAQRTMQTLRRKLGYDPIEVLATTEVIRQLMNGLSPLHVAVTALRGGLTNGTVLTVQEVADHLGLPSPTVTKLRGEAVKHMKQRRFNLYPPVGHSRFTRAKLEPNASISELRLLDRTENVLRSANVTTVGELTVMTSQDLATVHNMRPVDVYEIENKLHIVGLCLRSSDL